MKKIAFMSFMLVMALVVVLAAQAPAGGPPAGAGGAPGARGGQGGPGGPGGPGGRGGRGAPTPPAPPALQAVVDAVAAAINKQDSAALTKMLAMDCVYLDEDGHAPPCSVAVTRLMTTAAGATPKVFATSDSHGQMLDDNAAWVSFNYTLAETFRGGPKTLTGTTTMALKKVGTDWMVSLMHTALKQTVAGITQ